MLNESFIVLCDMNIECHAIEYIFNIFYLLSVHVTANTHMSTLFYPKGFTAKFLKPHGKSVYIEFDISPMFRR